MVCWDRDYASGAPRVLGPFDPRPERWNLAERCDDHFDGRQGQFEIILSLLKFWKGSGQAP